MINDLKNDGKNNDQIKNSITARNNNFSDNLESTLDTARAEIIGKTGKIDSTDYSDELYRVFRSGDDTKDNVEIMPADVSDCLVFFKNYEKFISGIKKTRKSLESEYNRLSKSLEKMVSANDLGQLTLSGDQTNNTVDYITKTDDADVISVINIYTKNLSKMVMDISNAHSLAFGAKLDAAKECYKQDKAILYKAYSKILKNHKD